MMRAIDQILAAVETQLAGIAGSNGVHRKPFHMLDQADLNCIVIDDVSDELIEAQGFWPRNEKRSLSFDVIPLVMAPDVTSLPLLGDLHMAVDARLFGSLELSRLGGLLSSPLQNPAAAFFSDAESLQATVCGWRIRIVCKYHTRSDLPGLIDKES